MAKLVRGRASSCHHIVYDCAPLSFYQRGLLDGKDGKLRMMCLIMYPPVILVRENPGFDFESSTKRGTNHHRFNPKQDTENQALSTIIHGCCLWIGRLCSNRKTAEDLNGSGAFSYTLSSRRSLKPKCSSNWLYVNCYTAR